MWHRCPSCGEIAIEITTMGDECRQFICKNVDCPNPPGPFTALEKTLGNIGDWNDSTT